MKDTVKTFRSWVSFAGFVLVVAVLYWAQAILIPIAIAILVTFVLTPPVSWLQRYVGRVLAAMSVVTLVFAALGVTAWGIGREMEGLARELPRYRDNIRQKIADVRRASKGGPVDKVRETLSDINSELTSAGSPRGTAPRPVIVKSEQADELWGFSSWLGPFISPLVTAGMVIVMVIFMLLERQELRNRLVGLFGHGHLAVTTKAFEEAGKRVSRQLLMQSLVNAIYGAGIGVGLYFIGVPYPLLWAALAAVLRFIPYVGPIAGAAAPILVTIAAIPGWRSSFLVMGLFLAFELFTNIVLETVLYAGSAGVSQVALLIAVAFWTWLWGPLGLLLSIPLTVCLVVLGKHVSGLEMVGTLMADTPALAPEAEYYQRLLARDQVDALDIVDRHIKTQPADTLYDALLLPALNYAERDRLEGRLTAEEENSVIEATRELIEDAAPLNRAQGLSAAGNDLSSRTPLMVFGCPANSAADELALHMLSDLLEGTPIVIDIVSGQMLSSEIVAAVKQSGCRVVCILDLPPSAPSKTRYLVRKLRGAVPAVKIIVGRCSPPPLADANSESIIDAGANLVATSLLQIREQLRQLAQLTPLGADKDCVPGYSKAAEICQG
jgi:predicted PurR-regulated permease PerM